MSNRGRKVSTAGRHQHHSRTIAQQRPRDWARVVSAVAESVWRATQRYWRWLSRYRLATACHAATLVIECVAVGVTLLG
jgi:hypothetical protein